MDLVQLRTLTEKSIINFGKYAGVSVKQLLSFNKTEVAWIYFNYEHISFTDSVLDAALVFKERRIEKPGNNKDGFYEYIAAVKAKGREGVARVISRNIRLSSLKKRAAKRLVSAEKAEEISPARMQAMNHGHIMFK